MPDPFDYDVFLSHSARDKPAVRQLAERLKGDGLRVWLDEWEIQPGDSIPLAIERGLERSRTLVLAMSRHAFESDWVTLERHTALFRDPTNRQRRFIPLRMDDAEISDTLRQFAYVDWRKLDAEQYARLLSACRPEPAEAPVAGPPSGVLPAHPVLSLGHTGGVNSVVISPDGTRALSASDDRTVKLWDLHSGACLKTLEGHTEYVFSVAISPDGTRALSASSDRTSELRRLDSEGCLQRPEDHTEYV